MLILSQLLGLDGIWLSGPISDLLAFQHYNYLAPERIKVFGKQQKLYLCRTMKSFYFVHQLQVLHYQLHVPALTLHTLKCD